MSYDLQQRILGMVGRLGFVPRKVDRSFLEQVPYWGRLLREADALNPQGLWGFLDQTFLEGYFEERSVPIPSLEQRLVGVSIAERGKVLELSKPGTRKTIATLSALVPIADKIGYMPRTLVTCPGYILPIWMREIERLFKEPNIVVVTRENRERAIERAAEDSTRFVLVGYDMTFRTVVGGRDSSEEQDFAARYMDVFLSLSKERLYSRLRKAVGPKRVEHLMKRKVALPNLVALLAEEESRVQRQLQEGKVMDGLTRSAFQEGRPFYMIIDEFHNIVHEDTKRGEAIASIARRAQWLALISGTGIGSTPDGLSWAAYLTGFVDRPADFRQFIQGKEIEKKVKVFVDLYGIQPIRTLKDVDARVKEPITVDKPYEISEAEIKLFRALLEAEQFDGREKYMLYRYLIANPHKLLPEQLSHLSVGDDPLVERLQQFYDFNPGLEEDVRTARRSRMEFVKDLVREVKDRGEKCLVVCEFQRGVTDVLEDVLKDLGVRRVDQTVSAELKEIRLTAEEKAYLKARSAKLQDPSMYREDFAYRSSLSARAKAELKILSYEVYGMSERERRLHEFATDPGIAALVSTRVLREGVELREARYIILFEDTTVPWQFEQFNGRTIRSGQHRQTFIWRPCSPALAVLEDYISGKREERQRVIDSILNDRRVSEEDMRDWLEENPEVNGFGSKFADLNARVILGQHFNAAEGAGSLVYSRALRQGNNALFVAELFNANWDHTYSGNVARLTRDVVLALERRKRVSLERMLDAACGPMSLARVLKRPVTGVDMNRYMMDYGLDACEAQGVQVQAFLGDISDLSNLAPLKGSEPVFIPGESYANQTKIADKSQDLVMASLVLDLLDEQGRNRFLREAYRVLDQDRYLIMVVPTKKMDPSCRAAFLHDLGKSGFSNVDYLTGTYQGFQAGEEQDVEAYVVVAQKQPEYSEDSRAFRLRPEVRIIDAPVSESKRRRRHSHPPAWVNAEYFVKQESQLDLRQGVDPEPLTVEQQVDRLGRESTDDEIARVLEKIEGIVREP